MLFEVGKIYETTDWFTGGTHEYKCISRAETNVTFNAVYHEIDGTHEIESETFDIHTDKSGNEYIVFYEYQGHENRMYGRMYAE